MIANTRIAEDLREVARLLEAQGANPFRVSAYRRAADLVQGSAAPIAKLVEQGGENALLDLPGIGPSLSHSIAQLVETGHLGVLDRLRGEPPSETALKSVPGIGPVLARRLHEKHGIETLAALEAAARSGRLEHFPGFGSRRARAVTETLAGRFRRSPLPPPPRERRTSDGDAPSVAELLDVDREYRRRAQSGHLPVIAPRRFNPTGAAWLPILHTERHSRHYTALYSNTARAHELGTVRDWVIIYRDDPDGHGQWTVVTGRFGKLANHRLVRGREAECELFYSALPPTESKAEL